MNGQGAILSVGAPGGPGGLSSLSSVFRSQDGLRSASGTGQVSFFLLGLSLMATQDVESLQAHEPHSRRTHESPRLLSIFTAGRASNDHRSPSSLHLLRYLGANWHDDLWILNVSHLAHAFAPALARPTVSFVQDESFVRRDPSTGSVLSPPATADGRTTVDGRIKFDLRKPLDALAADELRADDDLHYTEW